MTPETLAEYQELVEDATVAIDWYTDNIARCGDMERIGTWEREGATELENKRQCLIGALREGRKLFRAAKLTSPNYMQHAFNEGYNEFVEALNIADELMEKASA